MAYIYDLADVWASSGTTFTAIKMNVTDTASAAGSLLMDLQVGGSSFFSVRKDGRIIAGAATTQMVFSPTDKSLVVGIQGTNNGGFRHISGSSITLLAGAGYSTTHVGDAMLNGASGFVGWHGGAYSFSNLTPDLALARDAANTLAQRNGVNAQAFNLYNTYTDASNYERGAIRWNSNVLEFRTEAAGTGTARNIRLTTTGSELTTTWTAPGYGVNLALAGGLVRFGPASGQELRFLATGADAWAITTAGHFEAIGGRYQQFSEMTAPAAPGTNNVRIYAEDNGSGKTRLMALFATGAAQVIALEP